MTVLWPLSSATMCWKTRKIIQLHYSSVLVRFVDFGSLLPTSCIMHNFIHKSLRPVHSLRIVNLFLGPHWHKCNLSVNLHKPVHLAKFINIFQFRCLLQPWVANYVSTAVQTDLWRDSCRLIVSRENFCHCRFVKLDSHIVNCRDSIN